MNKVIISVLLTLALAALGGCGQESQKAEEPAEAPMAGIANPYTWYDSLEDLNKAADVELCIPEAEGKSDEGFSTIKGDPVLSQYQYSLQGRTYCLRAAKTEDDISGIYGEGGTVFGGHEAKAEMAETSEYYVFRWFSGDTQYVFSAAKDDALSSEAFMDQAAGFAAVNGEEIVEILEPGQGEPPK